MKTSIFHLLPLLFLIACTGTGEGGTTVPATPGIRVHDLQYEAGTLSGRVRNTGTETLELVLVRFTFKTPCGRKLLEKQFAVVPGGDKKSLAPGMEKHFTLRAMLSWRGKRDPVVTAQVVSVKRSVQKKR
ncbi:hypothetical protein KKF84_14340 [Myxococcota bacterium]|nr:hypothetical protein [Myxococcota bacterium]